MSWVSGPVLKELASISMLVYACFGAGLTGEPSYIFIFNNIKCNINPNVHT